MLKKFFPIVITILIMFSCFNVSAINYVTENNTIIPDAISLYCDNINTHTKRLTNEETDLNTIVFQNSDNTNSMYIFEQPVKYVDENGIIQDKSTELIDITNKNNGYRYSNYKNDVKLLFPDIIDKSKGIVLEYNNIKLELMPVSDLHGNAKINSVDRKDNKNNAVNYSDVFCDNISLRYTATFNGVKEDIILNEYTGQNIFNFIIHTNGLALSDKTSNITINDPVTNDIKANLGEILVIDSNGKNIMGELSYKTVKENQEYLLTIIVDDNYLTDSNTTFPVYIDPNLSIPTAGGISAPKTIVDTPLYSNWPTLAAGGSYYNNVGNMNNSNYGYSRSITKFPALMSNVSFLMMPSEIINSVTYQTRAIVKGSNAYVYACSYTGNAWDENTVTSANGMGYSTTWSYAYVDDTTSYNNFNITSWAIGCKAGTQDPVKGILLRVNPTYESNPDYLFRFASTEYGSSLPWVVINYDRTYTYSLVSKYSDRFEAAYSSANSGISAAHSFANTVFDEYGVTLVNDSISNQAMAIDNCPYGYYSSCTSTCGTNCYANHHRNIYRLSDEIYNGTRETNHIYTSWYYMGRTTLCSGTGATHVSYEAMANVIQANDSASRNIVDPGEDYIDCRPVIAVYTPSTLSNVAYDSMKLILAHELAHVFGLYDQYDDDGHDNGTTWTCIMNNFSSYYTNRVDFIQDIKDGSAPFCASCDSLLEKYIITRYFLAN
ncbi:MAG: hypothetical protein A2Y17_05425 [Clostridiales bacterium GWF2_38_85]|nr:MAG: hypothetical protein A2Y17_05425 [Clostridiales bacterium GWF2_38_85]HBL83329.1 hypothetical protein [Clostridiales bacterium]